LLAIFLTNLAHQEIGFSCNFKLLNQELKNFLSFNSELEKSYSSINSQGISFTNLDSGFLT
jgi:hypothetical protein